MLGLKFEISRHHFRQGAIKLKCSSSLLTIYWQSSMVRQQTVDIKTEIDNKCSSSLLTIYWQSSMVKQQTVDIETDSKPL